MTKSLLVISLSLSLGVFRIRNLSSKSRKTPSGWLVSELTSEKEKSKEKVKGEEGKEEEVTWQWRMNDFMCHLRPNDRKKGGGKRGQNK